jgi:hypothetical protein
MNKNLEEISIENVKLPKEYVHDELNQSVWDGEELKPEIIKVLKKIAADFHEYLKIDAPMKGIWFTGSLANYNWTNFSDIDLHILVDYDAISDDEEFVREYLDAKKDNWNNVHDIKIKDFDVEVYAQDFDAKHTSTGVYDVENNEWVRKPSRLNPEINKKAIRNKVKSIVDKIEKVEKIKDLEKAQEEGRSLKNKIKKMRQAGLDKSGEFSEENLTFKYLRNNGYIGRLFDKMRDSYDKSVSITEEERSSTFEYDEKTNYVSPEEVLDSVMRLDANKEYLDETVKQQILSFPMYKLDEVPMATFDTNEREVDDELVNKYMDMIKFNPDYPPIIYDPEKNSIIDGMHRVKALEKLGYDIVRAYVGKRKFDNEDFMNESKDILRNAIRNQLNEFFNSAGFHASMEDWLNKWKKKGIEIDDGAYGDGMDMGFKKGTLLSEDEVTSSNPDMFSPSEFDYREVAIGQEVEMEHTDDPEEAKKIAIEHLSERGDYYTHAIQCGLIDEPKALEIYEKYFGKETTIAESFKSKKQQRFFYAMANKPGKEGKKWKKWADEFSDDTDFDKIPEEVKESDLPPHYKNNPFKIDNIEKLKNISKLIYGLTGDDELSGNVLLSQNDDLLYVPVDSEMSDEDLDNLIKALRKNGYNITHIDDMSIEVDLSEPVFGLNESRELTSEEKHKLMFEPILNDEHSKNIEDFKEFILFCCKEGGINHPTTIHLRGTRDDKIGTTASYNPGNHHIHVYCKGRHKVDIMRSIAHELMHMIQMLENRLNEKSGEDGSPEENEAHSFSGLMIRRFGKIKPKIYEGYKNNKNLI